MVASYFSVHINHTTTVDKYIRLTQGKILTSWFLQCYVLCYMIDKLTWFPQCYVIWLTSLHDSPSVMLYDWQADSSSVMFYVIWLAIWHYSPIVMLYDWQADMIPSVLCYMIDTLTWSPQCYVIWLTNWHNSLGVMLYDRQTDMIPSVICYTNLFNLSCEITLESFPRIKSYCALHTSCSKTRTWFRTKYVIP